ncbi:damage-inducible protein DinB [Adhaeribacter sp. BT258]|uniref:Damage-inducible protein DinB n=1 Tax=Adhaeribacter terrigena TaxID=2793070 RepID=A0ABS1C351_9BACT|nr:DinB family protein [Adhaeribacter terrigena]MBK0403597.1 damage-inducible protein DinB [Adhaeribacter terrigena]
MWSTLQKYAEYNIWANDRLLNHLNQLPGEAPAQALKLFSHLLNAQAIWIARMTDTVSPVKVWQEHSLEQLRQLHEDTSNKLYDLLKNADIEEFNREIKYTNSQGLEYTNRVCDIFTHVFNHCTYHRAQVATNLRQNGFEPINTDYITYVRIKTGQPV